MDTNELNLLEGDIKNEPTENITTEPAPPKFQDGIDHSGTV